jgi:RNA polymerase sigma-70 factor (ECF subfamily)
VLFSTASKCLANQRRGALRGTELIARLGAEPHPAAPDEHEAAHRRRALVRAFTLLPDADRELLMLTVWEGLSSGRAAAVLGLAPATAHARVYRARKRLRRALAAELDDAIQPTLPRSERETA